MDYTQSIPDIYSDSFKPNSKKIILKIQKIQPKKYCISRIDIDISIDESKTLYPNIILINSNIECEIDNQYTYNNFIYFVNMRQKNFHYLSYDYNYNYNYDENKYIKNNDYIELYKINIINKKYNIYKFDDNYCTGDETMMIFSNDIRNYYFTFTICIKLKNADTGRKYKIDETKLKVIKLKSQNFIFSYKPIKENNRQIVLYLISITNIENDEIIKIDIKFTDVNTIYQKYENTIDIVKDFIFNKSDKEYEYEIETRYIEKDIKGIYYPNVIAIKN